MLNPWGELGVGNKEGGESGGGEGVTEEKLMIIFSIH